MVLSKRSNFNYFMRLAGAEAIAARAQPPDKGGNIVFLKNCQSSLFEKDIYSMHSGSFGHLRLKISASNTDSFIGLTMFIKENIFK